jgi:hypothetical protein
MATKRFRVQYNLFRVGNESRPDSAIRPPDNATLLSPTGWRRPAHGPRRNFFSLGKSILFVLPNPNFLDMGIGLAKPKQILVFGSVWTQTEYSARKPKMGALRRCGALIFAASAAKSFLGNTTHSHVWYQGQKKCFH